MDTSTIHDYKNHCTTFNQQFNHNLSEDDDLHGNN